MKNTAFHSWTLALALALCSFVLCAQTAPFKDGDRVMFLGDSITHGGWYVAQLQYIWTLRHPGSRVTLLNGGICGHTAKDGLARFDWDIAPQKPNRVFIMFGMNDVGHSSAWEPGKTDEKSSAFRREKVASFTANMRALIAKCRGIGATVTLITPTPYDEYSTLIEKKALPGVNDLGLAALAEATRQLATEEKTGLIEFYSVLTPILRDNPEIKFLVDRVHPHDDGHLLMAALVLESMGFSPVVDGATFNAASGARTFTYTPKALPIPAGRHYQSDDRIYPLTAKLNQEIVRITGLPAGIWHLKAAGKLIRTCSAAELVTGVNLATLDTPSQQKSQKGVAIAAQLKKLAGSLRGLPQGYIQVVKRGGDINDEKSTFEKLDQWVEELRVANLAGGHYYRYYGGEVKRFKELYPKREAEQKRLEAIREELFAHCRPEPFELSVEPVVSTPVPDIATLPRAELKRLFEENVFGVRPVERPPVEKFTQLTPDEEIFDGLGIRRRMLLTFGNGRGQTADVRFTAYIPKTPGPHPTFVSIVPHDPDAVYKRVSPGRPHRMPAKRLLARGFAAISYKNDDCALDYSAGLPQPYAPGKAMTNGVWAVFGPTGTNRTQTSWGAISAWAWGASRIMDWIETVPAFDSARVAVVGLSRCGKTALWAGASDERFALTISCCSGCGGAKLNRIDLPKSEHISNLKKSFPHWFANSYYAWAEKDTQAPFDMHGLVALCAPRRVIVASASEDAWAGQPGEFESCRLASPAWEKVGLKGLVAPAGCPAVESPLQEGDIAYHMRRGRHDQTDYDWDRYMDFFSKQTSHR